MKKIFLFVIAALGALTIASCEKEIDNTTPVDGAEVVVTISADIDGASAGEDKAMMHNPSGFKFQTGDVVTFTDAKGNTTTCTLTEAAKTATFTAVIPGLATGDVTGRFSVNYDGEIENDQTPSSAAFYAPLALQSKEITLKQGTQSVEVSVGFAGAFLRFWPVDPNATEADERIVAVSLGDYSSTCTASDAYKGLIYTTAINFQGLQIPATTCKPEYVLTTSKGTYTFTSIKQTEFKEGYLYDIPLNLTKASKSVKELTLTEGMISTNAPMQYVQETASAGVVNDTYGMGEADWVNPISEPIKTKRQTEIGTASNLWDGDEDTSFNTNQDIWVTGGGWAIRGGAAVTNHYIQIDLGTKYDKLEVYFQNAKYRPIQNTAKVYTSADGAAFTELTDSPYAFNGAGATLNIKDLADVRAIRISPSGSADWTGNGPSFGLSEVKVWAQGGVGVKVPVTGVQLDKTAITVKAGGSETLTPTVSPDDASDKSVTWSSSDEDVATVVGGVVTGVADGTATITVTTTDGGFTATCAVTVDSWSTLTLTEGMISTNAPMQYVQETSSEGVVNDEYGMGSADWVNPISEPIKTKRQTEIGTASNLWDGDEDTSFNTNQDIWVTGGGWSTRSGATVTNHYIQIDLGTKYDKLEVYFQNAKYRPIQNTAKVYTSADGAAFTELTDSPYAFNGAGATLNIKDLADVRAIRISPSGSADWTGNGPSFGLSEVKVKVK